MPHRILSLLAFAMAVALAGCGKGPDASAKAAGPAASIPPLLLASEDVYTVKNSALASGPSITGTVQPERRADLRAEIQAIVLKVLKENGDTATVGKELLKVIDPGSMRFEAMISADDVGSVKPGQVVHFRVNGYGTQEFAGKVRRVNPAANATTRQVEMLVDFTGDKQPKLAGLYAEGRLETQTTSSLTLPATAVVREGDKSSAWRVTGDKVRQVEVGVGERESRTRDL